MRQLFVSPRRRRIVTAARRAGFVAALLGIFAVGFGGSFTCKSEQNSAEWTGRTR